MYQGELEVTKEDLDIFLAVAKNTEHFNLNQEDPSQYTFKDIHPITKKEKNYWK